MVGSVVRVAKVLSGSFMMLMGLMLVIGGAVSLFLDADDADDDGYQMSAGYEVRSDTCAFSFAILPSRSSFRDLETRWTVDGIDPSRELFIGIADHLEVVEFLRGTAYEEPVYWEWNVRPYSTSIDVDSTRTIDQGGNSTLVPSGTDIWIRSAVGKGERILLEWDPFWEGKDHLRAFVIMNADGSPGIEADVFLGSRIPLFSILHYPLLASGAFSLLLGSIVLLWSRKG